MKIELSQVSYRWPEDDQSRYALNGVTLSLDDRTPICICGCSGSGKTTLAMLLGGFLKPTDGSITFSDVDTPSIAYVFQFPEKLFIGETLEAEYHELKDEGARKSFDLVCAELEFELPLLWTIPLVRLSVGEGRLLAVALQLARDPRVLILDEPTIGLDAMRQDRLLSQLENWQRPGRLLIVVTHDLHVLERLQGTAIVLDKGICSHCGKTKHLLEDKALLCASGLE